MAYVDPLAGKLNGLNSSAGDGKNFNEDWLNAFKGLQGTKLFDVDSSLWSSAAPRSADQDLTLGPTIASQIAGEKQAQALSAAGLSGSYSLTGGDSTATGKLSLGGQDFGVSWAQTANGGAGGWVLGQLGDNGVAGRTLRLTTDAQGNVMNTELHYRPNWDKTDTMMLASVLGAAAVGTAVGPYAAGAAGGEAGAVAAGAGGAAEAGGAAAAGTSGAGSTAQLATAINAAEAGAGLGTAGTAAGTGMTTLEMASAAGKVLSAGSTIYGMLNGDGQVDNAQAQQNALADVLANMGTMTPPPTPESTATQTSQTANATGLSIAELLAQRNPNGSTTRLTGPGGIDARLVNVRANTLLGL